MTVLFLFLVIFRSSLLSLPFSLRLHSGQEEKVPVSPRSQRHTA